MQIYFTHVSEYLPLTNDRIKPIEENIVIETVTT
jgi:hypothetical protein